MLYTELGPGHPESSRDRESVLVVLCACHGGGWTAPGRAAYSGFIACAATPELRSRGSFPGRHIKADAVDFETIRNWLN